MNKHYELEYALLDYKQIKALSFNISLEDIEEYFSTHSAEFKNWEQIELLNNIINASIPINRSFSIIERKKILQNKYNKEANNDKHKRN